MAGEGVVTKVAVNKLDNETIKAKLQEDSSKMLQAESSEKGLDVDDKGKVLPNDLAFVFSEAFMPLNSGVR
jgi:hypothetical protein